MSDSTEREPILIPSPSPTWEEVRAVIESMHNAAYGVSDDDESADGDVMSLHTGFSCALDEKMADLLAVAAGKGCDEFARVLINELLRDYTRRSFHWLADGQPALSTPSRSWWPELLALLDAAAALARIGYWIEQVADDGVVEVDLLAMLVREEVD